MADASLSVLLSQVLLAFTIEFDNEFELQMFKTWARPFRVSIVMWSNFMRYVDEHGTTVGAIARRSCIPVKRVASVVGGMERWGYIAVDHDPATGVGPIRKGWGSGRGIKASTVIRPSGAGTLAIDRWSPLVGEIEERWRYRLGPPAVEGLRDCLRHIDRRIDMPMPHYLPIVGGPMLAEIENTGDEKEPDDDLPALLARVLLAFTLDAEAGAQLSLPIGENVLRVISGETTPVKDLPVLACVSKEAVATSLTTLQTFGYIDVGTVAGGRGKAATLTSAGAEAQGELASRILATEAAWEDRFGADGIAELRASLQAILDRPGGEDGALSSGLVTPPGGWRAENRYAPLTRAFVEDPRAGLPHYPMVLHRGGWPDGS